MSRFGQEPRAEPSLHVMMPSPTSTTASMLWRLVLAAAALSACGLVEANDQVLYNEDIVLLSTSPVNEDLKSTVKMESTVPISGFQFSVLDGDGKEADISGIVASAGNEDCNKKNAELVLPPSL